MAKLIEKVYGEALFGLAVEEDKIDAFSKEVDIVRQVLAENKDLAKLMRHPGISEQKKEEILENIWGGRISREITGLMLLLLKKEHYGQIPLVLDYFLKKVRENERIGTAYVITAILLSDEQKDKVNKRLLETTTYKYINTCFEVDATIIGGMIIRLEDRILDSSIKTKLESLSRQLNQLKL